MWPFSIWIPYSVIFWSAIVLIVAVVSFFNYRTRVSRHRLLEIIAAGGQTITPDLIDHLKRAE
jgi:hypothetical protein